MPRQIHRGSKITANNHDDQLGEIYPMMLNELNCTFGVSLSRFRCCGHDGHDLWPSWYRPTTDIQLSTHLCILSECVRSFLTALQHMQGDLVPGICCSIVILIFNLLTPKSEAFNSGPVVHRSRKFGENMSLSEPSQDINALGCTHA